MYGERCTKQQFWGTVRSQTGVWERGNPAAIAARTPDAPAATHQRLRTPTPPHTNASAHQRLRTRRLRTRRPQRQGLHTQRLQTPTPPDANASTHTLLVPKLCLGTPYRAKLRFAWSGVSAGAELSACATSSVSHPQTPRPTRTEFRPIVRDETE